MQKKTWIPHTIGGDAGPIAPAYQAANIGEEKILTITLTDTYGNPVAGKYVEWFMQGVGFFNTDDLGDSSDPDVAANNKDFDVTNAAGKATVFIKSYDSGEQIVHAKVRDKGTSGAEGTYITYTAEVQWFDADIVTFDDPATQVKWVREATGVPPHWDYMDEALSKNPVNTSHEFCLKVFGLKLEYVGSVDYADGQTPAIDSDAAGASYDGVLNAKDAAYFGGIMMLPWVTEGRQDDPGDLGLWNMWDDKLIDWYGYDMRVPVDMINGSVVYDYTPDGTWIWHLPWDAPHDDNNDGNLDAPNGVIDPWETGDLQIKVGGVWLELNGLGAYTMYDWDLGTDIASDAHVDYDLMGKEIFDGVPGIYIPLAGKSVTFAQASVPLEVAANLGSITPPATGTTDAAGKACVTVASTVKGLQTIKGTVTWPGNPHTGSQLLKAYAQKTWTAGTVAAEADVTIEVLIDGVKVATNKVGEITSPTNPMWVWDYDGEEWDMELNKAHVEVHVKDAYGNDLPDYEVVYLLESIDEWLGGSQGADNTRIPFAYLTDDDEDNALPKFSPTAKDYDTNGSRPDSNEPSPLSDPFAAITGPGFNEDMIGDYYALLSDPTNWKTYNLDAHEAFFFNQWLGSDSPWHKDALGIDKRADEGQAGVPKWYARVSDWDFYDYYEEVEVAFEALYPQSGHDWDFRWDGFDGYLDGGLDQENVELATDGAKAWTLDGYTILDEEVVPNLLTGSNIDIQLAEGDQYGADHYTSILRIMVYAPGDGVIEEGSYIWSTQVHKNWEAPEPTTVTISPALQYAIAGLERAGVVAKVLDQFGKPYPDQQVRFYSTVSEGSITRWFTGNSVDTDVNGLASKDNDDQVAGSWGVEKVYAVLGTWANYPALPIMDGGSTKLKNASCIVQWIKLDGADDPGDGSGMFVPTDLFQTYTGNQQVTVNGKRTAPDPTYYDHDPMGASTGLNGFTLNVMLNPSANLFGVLGTGTFVASNTGITHISTNTLTWIMNQPYFVQGSTSDTDGVVNWIYDLVLASQGP